MCRAAILTAVPSSATFTDVAGALAVAGRADETIITYGREFARLGKFAASFGLPAIACAADVSAFLGDESLVVKYVGFSGQ